MSFTPPNYSLRRNRRGKHACSLCRKKKVKCDGNAPCSTCIKYKNQRCDLTTNRYSTNRNLQRLKLIWPNPASEDKKAAFDTNTTILNEAGTTGDYSLITAEKDKPLGCHSKIPYDSPQETISIFESGSKIEGSSGYSRQYFGPLSWFTLILSDEYTLPCVRYIEAHKKDFKTINEDLNVYTKEVHNFQDTNTQTIEGSSSLQKNTGTQGNASFFTGMLQDDDDDLVKRIKTLLPQRNVSWKLMDYFF